MLSGMLQKKGIGLVFIMLIVLSLWIMSGVFKVKDNSDKSGVIYAAPVVSVSDIYPEEKFLNIKITGLLDASKRVGLKSEMSGVVKKIEVQKGMQVKDKDVILVLHSEDSAESIDHADDLVKEAESEYERKLELHKDGHSSSNELARAVSSLSQAKLTRKKARLQLEKTTIRAPFSGTLGNVKVMKGDLVSTGTGVADFYGKGAKLVAFVSHKESAVMKKGMVARVVLNDGIVKSGKVSFVGKVFDQLTGTHMIEVEVDDAEGVSYGSAADAFVLVDAQHDVYNIPSMLLILDEKGVPGIKVIPEDTDNVEFVPVDLVQSDSDGMVKVYVQGYPKGLRLITRGSDSVQDGQKVEVVTEE